MELLGSMGGGLDWVIRGFSTLAFEKSTLALRKEGAWHDSVN